MLICESEWPHRAGIGRGAAGNRYRNRAHRGHQKAARTAPAAVSRQLYTVKLGTCQRWLATDRCQAPSDGELLEGAIQAHSSVPHPSEAPACLQGDGGAVCSETHSEVKRWPHGDTFQGGEATAGCQMVTSRRSNAQTHARSARRGHDSTDACTHKMAALHYTDIPAPVPPAACAVRNS